MTRRGEFPSHVKEEARKKAGYKCEQCGHRGHTEVHHILPLFIWARYYPDISIEVIASLANSKVLCPNCHIEADEKVKRRHKDIADTLKDLQPRLIED